MVRGKPFPELPLLSAGLPAVVAEHIRQAGIPLAPFRVGASVAKHVRRDSAQLVLFDSRNASSRFDAQTARDCGLKTINVAVLLAGEPGGTAGQATGGKRGAVFFERLKNAIESLGGLWVRVADYPYPFHAAACAETAAGRADQGADAPRSPGLTWRTTHAELARWLRVRRNISLNVRKENELYRIECDSEFGGFRPMLELWRGSHVACLPLIPGEMRLQEGGIAFQQEQRRHPAGLAALEEMESPAGSRTQSV